MTPHDQDIFQVKLDLTRALAFATIAFSDPGKRQALVNELSEMVWGMDPEEQDAVNAFITMIYKSYAN